MLLPFLLLGGKMNNCQLFIFQVRKIAPCRKYSENRRICNEKLRYDPAAGRAVHAGETKNTFDNKSSSR